MKPMSLKEQFQRIQEIVTGKREPQRFARQQQLEMLLVEFQPDANEASEMLDALARGLETRYADCTEVLLRMSLLKHDLERLDNNQQVDASDVLNAWEARQRGRKDD